jgi:hypothetical protein
VLLKVDTGTNVCTFVWLGVNDADQVVAKRKLMDKRVFVTVYEDCDDSLEY